MGDVAVLFGGPSPEHDISILTGLQAARGFLSQGRPPKAIFWSKLGQFFLVEPRLEASAFVDGAPRDAETVTLNVGDGGGFFIDGGRRKGPQRLDIDAVVLCTHGGPG